MSNKPELLVTLETTNEVFDFSLLARIIPGVIVGDRFMRLDTIEHAEYEEVVDESPENDDAVDTIQMLKIQHTSGNEYGFDPDEARELEEAVRRIIKQNEELQIAQMKQQREMMDRAADEALIRMSVNPKAGGFPMGRIRKQ